MTPITSTHDRRYAAIHQYLLYLVNDRKLSAETANLTVSALKFLYLTTLEMPWTDEYFPRVKRPSRLPVVLSQEEVLLFFDHITGLNNRAALMVCHGAELRISEAVALRLSDIDESRRLIRVEQGKGQKDRYAMLSDRLCRLLTVLQRSRLPAKSPKPRLSGSVRAVTRAILIRIAIVPPYLWPQRPPDTS
jgi:integrase